MFRNKVFQPTLTVQNVIPNVKSIQNKQKRSTKLFDGCKSIALLLSNATAVAIKLILKENMYIVEYWYIRVNSLIHHNRLENIGIRKLEVRRYEQTVIERNERGYPIAQANSLVKRNGNPANVIISNLIASHIILFAKGLSWEIREMVFLQVPCLFIVITKDDIFWLAL